MNNIINILTAKNIFVASLVFAAILMLFLAPKAAVNVDEQLHYPHAKSVVNWYFTKGADISCLDTPVTNLKYYGQSVDNFTALVNRVFSIKNEFLTRHFTGAFFFLVLLLFSGLTAWQLTNSYYVAALTVISMLAFPPLFGHAFGNLKDIPFAAGYMVAIFFILRFTAELPKPRWRSAFGLALAIAFTNSVRIGGLILFAYFGLALIALFLSKPFLLKQIFSTRLNFVRLLGQTITIFVIGYFAGLLFWPFALQNVLLHPFESLQVMEHYKVSIRQIFDGKWFWSTELPWYYLLRWMLMSVPEFMFVGFAAFLITFITKKKSDSKQLFNGLFLLFILFFPLVYVVVIKSNLYSGIRQMIFVLPVLAVLSSAGISWVIGLIPSGKMKYTVVGLFIALMFLPVSQQAATFPADYIYFNAISGGNKNAWSNYEYDYYFHALKVPADELSGELGLERAIVASNAFLPNYFENNPNVKFQFTRYLERSSCDWDYAVFGLNYIDPEMLKNGKWKSTEIVKTLYHKGNPVAVLMKRYDKSDVRGIELSREGRYDEARVLLEKAVKTDPNNVWLYVQLAKNSLKERDFDSFNRYLQLGRTIYPFYEPLYILEAQYLVGINEYAGAKVVLDELKKINPYYSLADKLLHVVNEKLHQIN